MRCACIDVGSNTTALLVAELGPLAIIPLATRRHFTLIGSDAGPSGISEAKLVEAENAVAELVEFAKQHSAERICVVATHVVREAANGTELADRIERRVGMPVEILDGHAEARYSFIGATGGIAQLGRPTIVVDAGGGSTEVTRCRPGGEPETATFPVGSAAVHAAYLHGDPPTADQIADARAFVEAAFAGLNKADGYGTALVVGGGASAARAILGGVIDRAGAERVLTVAMRLDATALAGHFTIELNRARLLPAGLIVLGALADHLGMPLEVGRGGLREGVLIDRFGGPGEQTLS